MTLEQYKTIISENSFSTGKEKYKNYFYSVFALNENITGLQETFQYNFNNKQLIIDKIGSCFIYSFTLLNDLSFPVNSPEFSLDDFKNTLKLFQFKEADKPEFYLHKISLSVGKIQGVIRKNIPENKEFIISDKILLINLLYDVITKLFLLTDFLHFDHNEILQRSTKLVVSEKPVKKKQEEKDTE